MRGIVRDAVLVAATATAIWFVRGDAETPQVTYGVPMQIQCQQGSIENASITEGQAYLEQSYNLSWGPTVYGPDRLDGLINLTSCVLYPDLRTPTP